MLKIALDARKMTDGGIGTYLKNILLEWAKAEIDAELFLFSLSKDRSILESLGDFVSVIAHDFHKYSFSEMLSFKKPLLKIKADIFFTPHYTLPFSLPCPSVATIHDLIHLRMPVKYGPLGRSYSRFMVNHTLKNCSFVLTDSEHSQKDIISLFPEWRDKINVINPGVDRAVFKCYPEEKVSRFRAENLLPDDFILYVGALKPHKNPTALVKIVNELNMNLVIVSQDMNNYSKLVLPQIKEKRLVRMINAKSDFELAMIYNCARVLVFPSFYEGFGLPPLEAMACGCPCVVSNRTSLPEVCGDAALYCAPDNLDDMNEKIDTLFNDTAIRNELVGRGIERSGYFTWSKTASAVLDILKKAAGK